jgi:hypothetical protein
LLRTSKEPSYDIHRQFKWYLFLNGSVVSEKKTKLYKLIEDTDTDNCNHKVMMASHMTICKVGLNQLIAPIVLSFSQKCNKMYIYGLNNLLFYNFKPNKNLVKSSLYFFFFIFFYCHWKVILVIQWISRHSKLQFFFTFNDLNLN